MILNNPKTNFVKKFILTLAIVLAINAVYAQGMLDKSKIYIMNRTLRDKKVTDFHTQDGEGGNSNTYTYIRQFGVSKKNSAQYTYYFNEQNVCQKYSVNFTAANMATLKKELIGYKALDKTTYESTDGKLKADVDKSGTMYTITFKLMWSTL